MPITNIKESGLETLIVEYLHTQNGYEFFASDNFAPEDEPPIPTKNNL